MSRTWLTTFLEISKLTVSSVRCSALVLLAESLPPPASGRLVATDTAGVPSASARDGLLDGLGGADHLAVGIEGLLGRVDAVEVHFGGDLGADVAEAHGLLEKLLDGARQPKLVSAATFVRIGTERARPQLVLEPAREKRAPVVDDRDPARREIGHRRRHQVLDRRDLLGPQPYGAAHAENHRRAGLAPLAAEKLAPRQHQMDSGGLYHLDRADGARQLALQRAHQVDVLDEVCGAQRIGTIEYLVAHGTAARQTLLRERQA